MDANTPSRLLLLPAELRLRIWEYALAPTGTLHLTSTNTSRLATTPTLAPRLLITNRQIHSEASPILYAENRITITADAHDTCWPTVSESRLPQRVLEKLQHLGVILDCTGYFRASYEDVDWTPFSALTSLHTLRLTIVRSHNDADPVPPRPLDDLVEELLPHILERIPVETKLEYGTEAGSSEREALDQTVERRLRGRPNAWVAKESDGNEVARIAAGLVDVQRGCKSGGVRDVFAEYR